MLRTLGGLRLQDHLLQQPKLLVLLAYLALEGPKERAHLQRLFWPPAPDPAGNLRVALRRLRAAVPTALALDGPRVATTVPTDAHALLTASEREEHARVVELYHGREGLAAQGQDRAAAAQAEAAYLLPGAPSPKPKTSSGSTACCWRAAASSPPRCAGKPSSTA